MDNQTDEQIAAQLEEISKELGQLQVTDLETEDEDDEIRPKLGPHGFVGKRKAFFKVHPLIKKLFPQCFFTWIKPEDVDGEEAMRLSKKLYDTFQNVSPEYHMKRLKFYPYETLSHKLICAFLNLIVGRMDTAAHFLSDITENIAVAVENEFILMSHSDAFCYLLAGLEALKLDLDRCSGSEDALKVAIEKSHRGVTPFEDLTDTSLQTIKAAKAFFYGCIRFSPEKQIAIFKHLRAADSLNIEWDLNIRFVMRQQRRETDRWACPSEEEKEVLARAFRKDPDNVKVKEAILLFLGDSIKWHGPSSVNWPVKLCNELEFKDIDEVKDYSMTLTKSLLDEMNDSMRVNLSIAEVFVKSFSGPLRNLELGKECLARAVELNPHGSKANHQLGQHLLVWEKKYDEALYYFERAHEVDPGNFPAFIELVQLKMRDNIAEEVEIFGLFEIQKDSTIWDQEERGIIHFYYGLCWLMAKGYVPWIEAWEMAYKLNTKVFDKSHLQNLYYHCKRYGWNCKRFEIDNALALLDRKIKTYPGSSTKEEEKRACYEKAMKYFKNNAARTGPSGNGNRYRKADGENNTPNSDSNWRRGNGKSNYGETNGHHHHDNGTKRGDGRYNKEDWKSNKDQRFRREGGGRTCAKENRWNGGGLASPDGNWRDRRRGVEEA